MPGLRETQLTITYRGSAIIRDERENSSGANLAAGDRAPDFRWAAPQLCRTALPAARTAGTRAPCAARLCQRRAGLSALAGLAGLARVALGTAASCFAIVPGDSTLGDREDIPVLRDGGGEFATAYGAAPGTTLLIRPDGHVGWFSSTVDVAGLKAALDLLARVSA